MPSTLLCQYGPTTNIEQPPSADNHMQSYPQPYSVNKAPPRIYVRTWPGAISQDLPSGILALQHFGLSKTARPENSLRTSGHSQNPGLVIRHTCLEQYNHISPKISSILTERPALVHPDNTGLFSAGNLRMNPKIERFWRHHSIENGLPHETCMRKRSRRHREDPFLMTETLFSSS